MSAVVALNLCFHHILSYRLVFKGIYCRNSYRPKKKDEIMSEFCFSLDHLIIMCSLKMTWFRLLNVNFIDGENHHLSFLAMKWSLCCFMKLVCGKKNTPCVINQLTTSHLCGLGVILIV